MLSYCVRLGWDTGPPRWSCLSLVSGLVSEDTVPALSITMSPKVFLKGSSGSQEIQVGGILIYNFSRNGENVGTTFLRKFLSLHAFKGYFYFGPNFSNAIRVFMDAQSSWGQGLLAFFQTFYFSLLGIFKTQESLWFIFFRVAEKLST